jgi:TctA family transporter
MTATASMVEDNQRRGLMITAGDPSPFFTCPVTLILFLMLVASVIWSTSEGKWLARASRPCRRRAAHDRSMTGWQ